mmetsp:Transcript_486/g.684  ORF Transcript_486/g.684 Transcript_486/m.684 type:complete len:85 (+) Transcript_486:61-315(+)|eukprot:CAMPEP_0194758780 /NCGR_PEP_ID=MMETSP0323_2-20130528/11977_1 /TAXON_ID=2866 ORGANISM="Crypthecodinium cohnii, Strain Seligo" /NCGR_SAMPLE_ID=MMETSP0323_2 /ASSEMBLY_ACC=CAM_ASM_000346 /LENGTH=84 /DNA_ID=CAMNT_0039679231 /DNA_START=69 /DNA_END=323 /DNA_ORIENTATION=-
MTLFADTVLRAVQAQRPLRKDTLVRKLIVGVVYKDLQETANEVANKTDNKEYVCACVLSSSRPIAIEHTNTHTEREVGDGCVPA